MIQIDLWHNMISYMLLKVFAATSKPLLWDPAKDARWCSRCPSKPNDAVDVKHLASCECDDGRASSFGPPGGYFKDARRGCSRCPSEPSGAVHNDVTNSIAAFNKIGSHCCRNKGRSNGNLRRASIRVGKP